MAITIVPFEKHHIHLVKEFNKRLSVKPNILKFPESHIPEWLPEKDGINIYQKFYLAVEENFVRGAYIIKYQNFFIKGESKKVGCLQLPISEGIIDRKYSFIGLQLIRDALKREPLLFALGIGGYYMPYAQLLLKLKWNHFLTPFYFKVINPSIFFKNLTYLRTKKINSILLDIAAYILIPGLIINLYQKLKCKNLLNLNYIKFERVDEFREWADEIWDNVKNNFSIIAERNSQVLNYLYPKEKEKFIKLKIINGEKIIGWVVLLATHVKNHKHFGNMYLGSIVDNLSLEGFENDVVFAATKFLTHTGVDLIVTNQSNINWVNALNKTGYINGPSNYIFFASKELETLLNPLEITKNNTFFNRGDGDGPVRL